MPFEQITNSRRIFTDPTITIGKGHIGFNQACIAPANLDVMKGAEIFWDETSRVLKLKPVHLRTENFFHFSKSTGGSKFISCPKFVHRIKPKTANGPLHIPARWDEKEKTFIAVVPRTK